MFRLKTCIGSSSPAEIDGTGLRLRVRLEPQALWSTEIEVRVSGRPSAVSANQADLRPPPRARPHVSPTGPRGRSVPVADLERQAHEIVLAGLNGREIQAFDDESLRAEQRAVNGRPLVSAMYLHNGPASS
jgi:hypothetical protein